LILIDLKNPVKVLVAFIYIGFPYLLDSWEIRFFNRGGIVREGIQLWLFGKLMV
jgi:hypothetical protein